MPRTASNIDVRNLPPMVDVPTAAAVLGISRSYAFELARRGDLPVKCIKVGSRYRVPRSALVALLDTEPSATQPRSA
jgi:excisionase family DNA binding protein